MNTFTPRDGASETSDITRAGERCALATVISLVKPNSFSTSTAGCIVGASESDPINIKTSGKSLPPDVVAVLHAVKRYQPHSVVGAIDCGPIIGPCRDDCQYATTSSDDLAVAARCAGVKQRDIRYACRRIEAVNHGAACHRPRVSGRSEHDGNRNASVESRLTGSEITVRRRLNEREQFPSDERHHRLRLGIAKAT